MRWALFGIGLAISLLMRARAQVGGDGIILLSAVAGTAVMERPSRSGTVPEPPREKLAIALPCGGLTTSFTKNPS